MFKNRFIVLSICLLVGLSAFTETKETQVYGNQSEIQETVNVSDYQDALDMDNDYHILNVSEISITDSVKAVNILKAEDDEDSSDQDTSSDSDADIPFSTSLGFQWWWIVIIVGTIALIFLIAWLIFFIWDRKEKRKHKKNQKK